MQLELPWLLASITGASSPETGAVASHRHYVVSRVDAAAEWQAQLQVHPFRNIDTSWVWGEYRSRLGRRVERRLVRNRNGVHAFLRNR